MTDGDCITHIAQKMHKIEADRATLRKENEELRVEMKNIKMNTYRLFRLMMKNLSGNEKAQSSADFEYVLSNMMTGINDEEYKHESDHDG